MPTDTNKDSTESIMASMSAEQGAETHEIDAIWTSTRTARQMYALQEVEKVFTPAVVVLQVFIHSRISLDCLAWPLRRLRC
jgi:hypothetical protein